jgi:hypothetical protein
MSGLSYPFTPSERARLAHYRAAVQAGFYDEGWGSKAPELPLYEGVSFARPLAATAVEAWRQRLGQLAAARADELAAALAELGVVRERVYLQEAGDAAIVLVTYQRRAGAQTDERALDAHLLRMLGLEPGQPGPAGVASLVLELEVETAHHQPSKVAA